MDAITLKELERHYTAVTVIIRRRGKRIAAIKGISFSIPEGDLFGLLGPNGAGKTTTI